MIHRRPASTSSDAPTAAPRTTRARDHSLRPFRIVVERCRPGYGMRRSQEMLLSQPRNMSDPQDDYTLMRAIMAGDSAALKTLYDRHSSSVYTLCLRMLKDVGEAEQLLTDVFFEIWNSRDRYDELRAQPLTYLMRVTRSRAIDRLRRKGPVGAAGVSLDPAAGIDVAVDDAPSLPAELSENRILVTRALGTLDDEQRRAIECSYYDGLSHAQIAEKLNKPLGTVKSNIRLGLIRLREILSQTQGTGTEKS